MSSSPKPWRQSSQSGPGGRRTSDARLRPSSETPSAACRPHASSAETAKPTRPSTLATEPPARPSRTSPLPSTRLNESPSTSWSSSRSSLTLTRRVGPNRAAIASRPRRARRCTVLSAQTRGCRHQVVGCESLSASGGKKVGDVTMRTCPGPSAAQLISSARRFPRNRASPTRTASPSRGRDLCRHPVEGNVYRVPSSGASSFSPAAT